jgi:hypothetical protein
MKHIWVVESSGGRKWRPAGRSEPYAYFIKKTAKRAAKGMTSMSPGLKWRVAKYERVK